MRSIFIDQDDYDRLIIKTDKHTIKSHRDGLKKDKEEGKGRRQVERGREIE